MKMDSIIEAQPTVTKEIGLLKQEDGVMGLILTALMVLGERYAPFQRCLISVKSSAYS